MAATPSTMVELGTTAPDFLLPDVVSGKNYSLQELAGRHATVIMFICNHCPYVKHINSALVNLANHYIAKGIQFVAISSNDAANYPDDAPPLMKETAHRNKYPFPYLYDEAQDVARAYDAACTPDFFVFDEKRQLVYRGQFDDSRPGNNKPVTGADMRQALDCILNHEPLPANQKPSIGCNIKWKK